MKRYAIIMLAGLSLVGCAPHNLLKPKPEPTPEEAGYKVLRHGEKDFVLKGGKKYVVAFPGAQEDNFYLVLKTKDRPSLKMYFTDSYLGRKGRGKEIADQTPFPDSMSVYPVGRTASPYFWMVDQVTPEKLELKIEYRYVPQWRFKFENKYQEYTTTLEGNTVDRAAFNAINESFDFGKLNLDQTISQLTATLGKINGVHQELLAIDSIFPKDIRGTGDAAVQNYRELKAKVEDELLFQNAWLATAKFFKGSLKEHAPVATFVDNAAPLAAFFAGQDRYTPGILTRARSTLTKRFDETGPFFEATSSGKTDTSPFDERELKRLDLIDSLSAASGVALPEGLRTAGGYIRAFNAATAAMAAGEQTLGNLAKRIKDLKGMPDNQFYANISAEAMKVRDARPPLMAEKFPKYGPFTATQKIDASIGTYATRVTEAATSYSTAASLVPQLTDLFGRQEYRAMLTVLKQHPQLQFLQQNYREVDKLSLTAQAQAIGLSIESASWAQAEAQLKELHADVNFLDMATIAPLKEQQVLAHEERLVSKVEEESARRVRAFMKANLEVLDNIDSMYADSAFLPVYVLRFTSQDPEALRRRQAQVESGLENLKHVEFPATAIKQLYDGLMANPADNGVNKARAVVEHGKQYTGKDAKVKTRISECDPHAAKWLTKPKEYRRILALPVTSKKGENEYLLRLNVRIPTDAKFPVYDVNIKLPKTVAEKAASTQWFDKISINKELIKNEGRYTITSPGPTNEYECQITPVRMLKDEDNILEIRFKHPSFTVLPVSVMAQKPIIKKN